MEKPNWRTWRSTPKVEVWQACVLAVGLEPSSMKREDLGWMADNREGPYITSKSFPNTEIEKDYKDLFHVLTANLFEHKPFNVLAIPRRGRGFCTIRLDVFVAWATLKVDWLKLPPELARLVLDKTNDKLPTINDASQSNTVQASDKPISAEALRVLLASLPEVDQSSASDASQASARESNEAKGKKKLSWERLCEEQRDDVYLAQIASGKAAPKKWVAQELAGRCKQKGFVTLNGKPVQPNYIERHALNGWKPPELS